MAIYISEQDQMRSWDGKSILKKMQSPTQVCYIMVTGNINGKLF